VAWLPPERPTSKAVKSAQHGLQIQNPKPQAKKSKAKRRHGNGGQRRAPGDVLTSRQTSGRCRVHVCNMGQGGCGCSMGLGSRVFGLQALKPKKQHAAAHAFHFQRARELTAAETAPEASLETCAAPLSAFLIASIPSSWLRTRSYTALSRVALQCDAFPYITSLLALQALVAPDR
jgi:hypothetical protein